MRKRWTAMLLASTLILSLTGCGAPSEDQQGEEGQSEQTQVETETEDTQENEDQNAGNNSGNVLVAYFSWADNAVLEEDVDAVSSPSVIPPGNVQQLAGWVQDETGGDLFAIETVQEYPGTHDDLLDFAYNEMLDDERPDLASQIQVPGSYDVIFLGYPNWNEDLPMPLYTFLEEYDFSGKTIIPFTTHGGSGFSRTIQTIADMQPDAAVVEDGPSISRNDVGDAQGDVSDWIAGLGLASE